MRFYFIIVVVLTGIFLGVASVAWIGDLADTIGGPEWFLQGEVYRRYTSFDYYRDRLQEDTLKAHGLKLEALGNESDLQRRWQTYRTVVAAQERQASRRELFNDTIVMLVAGVIFTSHFWGYRSTSARARRKRMATRAAGRQSGSGRKRGAA